jgi:hypothetical protein
LSVGSDASVRSTDSTGSRRGSCALPSESVESPAPSGDIPDAAKRSSNRVQTFAMRSRSMPAGSGAASSR